jgi:hypothetical protein
LVRLVPAFEAERHQTLFPKNEFNISDVIQFVVRFPSRDQKAIERGDDQIRANDPKQESVPLSEPDELNQHCHY